MFRILIVGLIGYFVAESNACPASFITPCKPDDKECIRSSAEAALPRLVAGIPELGIQKLDPSTIDSVNSEQAGLKFGFKDLVITGVSKCKILDLERDTTKSTVKLTVECPLHFSGKYHLKGKLLLFEAYGDGDVEISTQKVRFIVEVKIKDIVKDGQKYWKITGFDYSYKLLDKVEINLTNLYDGDEKKAAPMLATIKDNSNAMVEEIGGDMILQLLTIYVDCVKTFIMSCPASYLEIAEYYKKSCVPVATPFIHPCKPNDQKCILSSGKAALPYLTAGVPELGLPVVDPITINEVRSDGVNLKLGFRNLKITGVTKCKIIDLSRNPERHTIKLTVECPLHAEGQYDLNGKLAFINAYGDGDFKIYTNKVSITVEIKVKDIQKNGRKHWKVTGFDYSYEMIEKVYIDLKNLFDGDEKRAKPLKDILDHSWKEIIDEVGGPMVKQVIGNYVNFVKAFFLAVPCKELEIA
ncbi:uncharacterized protein LOC112045454 [Bicyclus anynana]|uniref:Uncharacterized protein LOC112045454 n=1 Tax=Bicyclus anynana TaxID=110368 RepID=A0ABM3LPT0_BICAN|nr:uncharacterized protein LOC112045454 [Bicyclus anynana]